jgi:hypothetical protein
MIVLMAGHRQAIALDGVSNETGRPVVVDIVERFDDRRQIVAAEVTHQLRQFFVGSAFDQLCNRALVADVIEQPLAPGRATLEQQRRIELVRAGVNPLAQGLAAWFAERRLLQGAVFQDHDVPAKILEQVFVALPQTLAHHRIEALPVVVDDPPAIAQALLPAFEHGLENVALVELGVADQRDHATFRTAETPAMCTHVILDQRREQRLRDTQAY